MKNPKFTLGIRVVAGCYLIYLAYVITRDGLLGKENLQGWQFGVALAGVIVFVVVGILIAYQASKTLMAMHREEKLKAAEEAAEQAAQQAMWQQQSSSERFRNMKSLADLEAGTLSSAAAAEEIVSDAADPDRGQTVTDAADDAAEPAESSAETITAEEVVEKTE
ncbi:MAG: hypothetical protein IJI10_08905 [Eubacterium sp.]|nr:hypothetical protein [Eubacterium sp.]